MLPWAAGGEGAPGRPALSTVSSYRLLQLIKNIRSVGLNNVLFYRLFGTGAISLLFLVIVLVITAGHSGKYLLDKYLFAEGDHLSFGRYRKSSTKVYVLGINFKYFWVQGAEISR